MENALEKHPHWFKVKIERRDVIQAISGDVWKKVTLAGFTFLETKELPENLSSEETIALAAFIPDFKEAWSKYEQRISTKNRTVPYDTESESEEKETETEEHVPPISPKGGSSPAFEMFWALYPRKEAKLKAKTAWNKLQPDTELTKRILTAIEQQKKSSRWTRDDGQFIPYPSTWLNQRRWEDELEPEKKRQSSYDIDELERMSFFDVPEDL